MGVSAPGSHAQVPTLVAPGQTKNVPLASCQHIELIGKVETPADFPPELPIELTMTYQMNYQKNPALLLENYPLRKKEFVLTLAPTQLFFSPKKRSSRLPPESLPESFPESAPETQLGVERETIAFKFVAPKMFLYPREIRFQYYARTPDGRWQSAYLKTTYLHEKKELEGRWECMSEVDLSPLVLKQP